MKRNKQSMEQDHTTKDENENAHCIPRQAWGDAMGPKGDFFRIVYNNCNGISATDKFVKCHDLGDGMVQLDADVIGLSETCLDWSNGETLHTCRSLLRKHCRTLKTQQSSSDKVFSTPYQPGGTMTIIRGKWAGRTTAEHNDTGLGRWSELRMQGRHGRVLTMMTVYRVCNQSSANVGHTTAFRQQYDILESSGVRKPDPRKQVFVDLEKRIETLQSAGEDIIVMMDANESLQNSQGELTKWVKRLMLVDVIAVRHGTNDEPATHVNGSERIDHIFCSPVLSTFIKASGILPFETLTSSDHRPLYLDLDLTGFMHGDPSPLESCASRGIMSNDPRAVRLYREILQDRLNETGIETQLDRLLTTISTSTHGFDPMRHGVKLDVLEQTFSALKLEAEKACIRIQSHPWSPRLRHSRLCVRYWSMWVTQLRCGVDLSDKLNTIKDQVIHPTETITITVAQSQLRKARTQLKSVLRDATKLRLDHLEDRARIKAMTGPDSTAMALSKIISAEQQRTMWAKLRRGMGKLHSGGLTHILVENPNGTHTCISDRAEMEHHILERNKTHFGQADGTPFTMSPLTDILGRHGTTETAQKILEGEYDKEIDAMTASDATKAILRKLRRSTPENSICDHISADDLRGAYAKWRESTSTSPSGLHLGHEKAVLRMENAAREETDELSLSERVFRLKAKFLNAAIQHCHVYDRWKTIVNATIEKIPGKPLVHKLRIIHLIESDFNVMIGILWGRRLMQMGELNSSFGTEQYGSRKEKSAISLVVGKQAKLSAIRMAAASCCLLENDAKSCFDRIVMLLVSLVSQKEGMSQGACKLFLHTLDQVRYHIKTQMGISDGWYGTTKERTVHGPGQGGKGSPSVWVTISCLIMDCLRDISDGLTMHGTDGRTTNNTVTTGFVDDITLWIGHMLRSLTNQQEAQNLIDHMTLAAQRWEELLYSTGGKLELSKCFLYLITWTAGDNGIPRLVLPHELGTALHLRDSGSGTMLEIEIRSSHEAYKTLGVLECPSGNYASETARLIAKANDFARRVSTLAITRHDAWALYHTMIMPSMLYSASVGTLSRRDADKISSRLKHSILSSMGYNCHMPLPVVYGSKRYGGLGLTHMFAAQGAAKALTLLKFIRCGNEIGADLLCQYQWAQVVAGTSTQILEDPTARIPQLDSETGIQTLREFLSMSKMSIRIQAIRQIPTKRQNDTPIMDIPIKSIIAIKDVTLQLANFCRLYLRAESLADITSANGLTITQDAWQCKSSAIVQSDELWPKQDRPGPKCIRAWQKLLRSICQERTRHIRHPLGSWLTPPTLRLWPAILDTTNDTVALLDDNLSTYTIHSLNTTRRCYRTVGPPVSKHHTHETSTILAWLDASDDAIPVEAGCNAVGTRYIRMSPLRSDTIMHTLGHGESDTWHSYVTTRDAFSIDLLSGCDTEGAEQDHQALADLLQDKTAHMYIVSDGGCRDTMGSYGFVCANASTGQRVWSARGRVRGFQMSSYRAEAKGMLAACTLVYYFAKFHEIHTVECAITQYCDNEALVKETNTHCTWNNPSDTLKPEYDLLRAIYQTRYALKLSTTALLPTKWVKGHQESTCPWHQLPLEAQLNVEADAQATTALLTAQRQHRRLQVIPNSACAAYLLNNGCIQTRDESTTLHTKWRDILLFDHYHTRFKISMPTLRNINWEGLRMARQKLDTNELRYSNKLQAGWLKSGTRAAKENELVVLCHRCGEEESNDHVLQCHKCAHLHQGTIHAFDEFLTSNNTSDAIRTTMTHGISRWLRQDKSPHVHTSTCPRAHLASKNQDAIGWNLAMKGMISTDWATGQSDEVAGDVWSSHVSLWLIRECRKYWSDRNSTRQESSSPAQPNISRAKAEADAQTRQLYGREMEIPQQERARFFRVPLVWRLNLPAKQLQQWVTENRKTFNRVAVLHAERQRIRQPDIREAWNDRPAANRPPRQPTIPTLNPQPTSPRRRTANATAELRAAQPRGNLLSRLQAGQRSLKLRQQARKDAKKAEGQQKLDREATHAAKLEAKAIKRAEKSAAKMRHKQDGTTLPRATRPTSFSIRQTQIRPHTQTMIEHALNARRGTKFKDAALRQHPTSQQHKNNIEPKTIPQHSTNTDTCVTETASLR